MPSKAAGTAELASYHWTERREKKKLQSKAVGRAEADAIEDSRENGASSHRWQRGQQRQMPSKAAGRAVAAAIKVSAEIRASGESRGSGESRESGESRGNRGRPKGFQSSEFLKAPKVPMVSRTITTDHWLRLPICQS